MVQGKNRNINSRTKNLFFIDFKHSLFVMRHFDTNILFGKHLIIKN